VDHLAAGRSYRSFCWPEIGYRASNDTSEFLSILDGWDALQLNRNRQHDTRVFQAIEYTHSQLAHLFALVGSYGWPVAFDFVLQPSESKGQVAEASAEAWRFELNRSVDCA
jgi:hypothetical protein